MVHTPSKDGRARALFGALTALALGACNPAPPPSEEPPAAGGWHEFQGSWNATGTRHTILLGGGRRASLVDLNGSLLLAGASRPGVGFRGEAIALNDSAKGLVGYAVWTDERGDQVFSELAGEGTATGNRITGAFVGGTGRFAGATGTYAFAWQYVLEAEDGSVQGRAVGLQGRVRFAPPQAQAPGLPAPTGPGEPPPKPRTEGGQP